MFKKNPLTPKKNEKIQQKTQKMERHFKNTSQKTK